MKKGIYAGWIATLLLTGCTTDDAPQAVEEVAMQLHVQAGSNTRAEKTTFGAGDQIGLFITTADAASGAAELTNVLTEHNNSLFTCIGTDLWQTQTPITLSEAVTAASPYYVFAYYPYQESGLSADWTMPVEMNTDATATTDYMYSRSTPNGGTTPSAYYEDPYVDIVMEHAFAKVSIAKLSGDAFGLKSISLANKSGATGGMAQTGTVNILTGAFTADSETDYTTVSTTNTLSATLYHTGSSDTSTGLDACYILVPPTEMTADGDLIMTVTAVIRGTETTSLISIPASITATDGKTYTGWEAGYEYKYTLRYTAPTGFRFTPVDIVGWGEDDYSSTDLYADEFPNS